MARNPAAKRTPPDDDFRGWHVFLRREPVPRRLGISIRIFLAQTAGLTCSVTAVVEREHCEPRLSHREQSLQVRRQVARRPVRIEDGRARRFDGKEPCPDLRSVGRRECEVLELDALVGRRAAHRARRLIDEPRLEEPRTGTNEQIEKRKCGDAGRATLHGAASPRRNAAARSIAPGVTSKPPLCPRCSSRKSVRPERSAAKFVFACSYSESAFPM